MQINDASLVHSGQRLSEKLLKQLEGEHPLIAMIGLGVAFAATAYHRVKIPRGRAIEMIETLYNALLNPQTDQPQEAASRLIVPRF